MQVSTIIGELLYLLRMFIRLLNIERVMEGVRKKDAKARMREIILRIVKNGLVRVNFIVL